ncbi:MAG: hypothetical protein COT74_10010 [Bdellovibrionales bacterium CG10_big_fil_rev_8_21_14_0_10_45_34]|nr:MAG: hypothetical protein COT74_10010 [Bdellovibrionales bacterium CG10_big_fil_rev_8_21_14_0_10_45_34]
MKRFLIWFVIFYVVLAAVVVFVGPKIASPYLKQLIIEKAQQEAGVELQIGALNLEVLPAPRVDLSDVKVTHPTFGFSADLSWVTLQSHWNKELFEGRPDIYVTVQKGSSVIKYASSPDAEIPPAPEPTTYTAIDTSRLPVKPKIHFNLTQFALDVLFSDPKEESTPSDPDPKDDEALTPDSSSTPQKGTRAANIFIREIDITLDTQNNSLSLSLDSEIKSNSPIGPIDIPIKWQSEWLLDSINKIEIQKSKLTVADLPINVSGQFLPPKDSHNWVIGIPSLDLSSISWQPSFLPLKNWTGHLIFSTQLRKDEMGWSAAGGLEARNIGAVVGLAQTDYEVKGPISANMKVNYSFRKEELTVEPFSLSVNASELAIRHGQIFEKPANTHLSLETSGRLDREYLTVHMFRTQLSKLRAQGSLRWPMKNKVVPFQSTFELAETDLKGLEKLFPLAAKHPLTGKMKMQVSVSGRKVDPWTAWTTTIESLELDSVSGRLDYADQKTEIRGPFTADANMRGRLLGWIPLQSALTAKIDLSSLSIRDSQFLTKKQGLPLRIQAQWSSKRNLLSVKNFQVITPAGTANIIGEISNLLLKPGMNFSQLQPHLNVKLKTSPIDLSAAQNLSPMLSNKRLSGKVQLEQNLIGQYSSKDTFLEQNLRSTGTITFLADELIIPQNSSAQTGGLAGSTDPQQKKREPLFELPEGKFIDQMSQALNIEIKKMNFGSMQVKNLKTKSTFKNRVAMTSGSVSEVFEGQLVLNGFQIDMKGKFPQSQGAIKLTQLNIEKALHWWNPEWSKYFAGSATGEIQWKSSLETPVNVDSVVARGSMTIENGHFRTLPFETMIDEKLAQLPGVGEKARLRTGGARLKLLAPFTVKEGAIHLASFRAISPEKNELLLNGKMGFNKSLDLEGTAYLVDAPIKGSVREANSDPQGRLEVPIRITGRVDKPDFDVQQTILTQWTKRTLAFEANKVKNVVNDNIEQGKQEIRNRAGEELIKQRNKVLEDLLKQ